MSRRRIIRLDRANGVLFGVCAGIAAGFGFKANYLRLALIGLTLVGLFPWTLIAYGLAAWIGHAPALRGAEPAKARREIDETGYRILDAENFTAQSEQRLASGLGELRKG